ncbi:MAG: hypothetical protein ACOYJU_06605 [Anaerovoracaceae bacterium]|jgi:hypothetical protein
MEDVSHSSMKSKRSSNLQNLIATIQEFSDMMYSNRDNLTLLRIFMKEKSKIKLYNVLFPMYMLWILPPIVLVLIPANFVIDSIVLVATLSILQLPKKEIYKMTIVPIWGFGFLADLIGSAFLFCISQYVCDFVIGNSLFSEAAQEATSSVRKAIEYNPFSEVPALFITLFAIAISGFCIYKFNVKITLKHVDIISPHKKRIALALAIFTAPYTLLVPASLFF